MCYSAEFSLRTSLISLIAIISLLLSGNPNFKWLAIVLIGWCGMQFVEFLLWLTNPEKMSEEGPEEGPEEGHEDNKCSEWNNLISVSLVPLVLILHPLGPLFGSLFVIPWNKSSIFRKYFFFLFSLFIISSIVYFYDNPNKCTTVTLQGHLWWSSNKVDVNTPVGTIILYSWAFLIILPFLLFWDKNFIIIGLFVFIPLLGLFYDRYYTDSKGSIWCYYTSYSSITALVLFVLHKLGLPIMV